ncbi:MAG: glycoside hydrolase family 19 protein [Nitrosomonas sp.]|uniref:glycoside hydrolase family 19 protein n=1 Tax=Nitrosomonas sp. TaxID=42353 RepID=UPI0025DC35AF|nr:glycoside hydrolase family 19 protein [Nitrosomonas sp.]MBY0474228.1 glycoside hydrolase family 19 protein [Nitrosomonas sp.]
MINYSSLRGVIPESVFDELLDTATRFGLNNRLRLAHFLAQVAHESNYFSDREENLNYSEDGLKRVFRKYFPDDLAKLYARHPQKIASRVYANRMGNGSEATGEGWIYRGRGYIQLTGKDNYAAFQLAVPDNVIVNPDLVATKYPLFSAGWFWNSNRLNDLADKGDDQMVVTEITKKINGGYNGLEDRLNKFHHFNGLLKNDNK